MFFGFCKHFILNDLVYTQGIATLVLQLGYELSSSEVLCFLAKLWILYYVHLHFQGFKIKIFKSWGLSKTVSADTTQWLWLCGGQQTVFFFSVAFICPCATKTTPWFGYRAPLWGHRIFYLLTFAFPTARPLEVQTFLVSTFVAVLALKHSHTSPVWLKCWLWFLFSVPNTSVNSWATIASPLAVMLWKVFYVRVSYTSLSCQWLVPQIAS